MVNTEQFNVVVTRRVELRTSRLDRVELTEAQSARCPQLISLNVNIKLNKYSELRLSGSWMAGWLAAAHVFDTNKQSNDNCRCSTDIFTRIHYHRIAHTELSIVHRCESANALVRIRCVTVVGWRLNRKCFGRMRHVQSSIRSIERRGIIFSSIQTVCQCLSNQNHVYCCDIATRYRHPSR